MQAIPHPISLSGRELARIMVTLQAASDTHKRELASCVDLVFVRHCHKHSVLEVLRPVAASLVADGDAHASRLSAIIPELENMEEDEAFDHLGWRIVMNESPL